MLAKRERKREKESHRETQNGELRGSGEIRVNYCERPGLRCERLYRMTQLLYIELLRKTKEGGQICAQASKIVLLIT